MDISHLIAEHGAWFYLIAFIWTFLEGETFVLFAAFAAAQGLLNRFPKWRYGVESALYWLERYNTGFILTFRFIYGIRNFSSFAMGLSAVHWKRFFILNCLAASLWAGSFVAAGYFLGHAFRAVLGHLVRSFSLVMLIVFIAFAVAVWVFHRLQRRRQLRVPPGAKIASPPP